MPIKNYGPVDVDEDEDDETQTEEPGANPYTEEASGGEGSTEADKSSTPGELSAQEGASGAKPDKASQDEQSKIPGMGAKGTKGKGAGAAGAAEAAAVKALKDATPVGRVIPMGLLKKHKKGSAATGVVGGAVVLALLLGTALLPGRLESFFNNPFQRWMANVNQTVEEMGQEFYEDYLKHHVFPALTGTCPSTRRDKSCVAAIPGKGPVSQLYNTWRIGNLEGVLAEKGYEIYRDNASGRIYMKMPGEKDADLTPFAQGSKSWQEVTPNQARTKLADLVEGETLAKRVMFRLGTRKVLAKYGVMRCIVACDTQDKLTTKTADMERAVKVYGARVISNVLLARRVQDPMAQGFSLAIQCLLSGGCDGLVDGENGEKLPKYQQQLSLQLKAYAASFGKDKLDEMFKKYEGLIKDGYVSYVAQQIADKIVQAKGGDAADRAKAKEQISKVVFKSVPIAGWATFVGETLSSIKSAGPMLTAARYALVTTGSIQMSTFFKSAIDESKAGQSDLTILGSISDSLNPGAKQDGSGPAAEATPWYQAEFQQNNTTTSLLDGIFGNNKAYAQTTQDQVTPGEPDKSTYFCDDGKPVPEGKLVCEEEVAAGGVAFFNAASAAVPGPIADLGGAVATAGSWLLAPFSSILSHIQPFSSLSEWLASVASDFLAWMSRSILALPFDDMSGGRKADLAMGGTDALGNEITHNVLGGQVTTDPGLARAAYDAQMRREYETFRQRPLFARIFDKESSFSLVTRLSLSLPSGFRGWQNSFASLLSNPLGGIASSFSSVFSSNKVLAQPRPVPDPMGITQYYVPLSSPAFTDPRGPEAFWEAQCADGNFNKAWRESSAIHVNPLTGQADNPTSNPCMTIEGSVEPYGALMGLGAQ